MSRQYVVVAFLDATLVPAVIGPFRSGAKAEQVCESINAAGEWSVGSSSATIVAEVVRLVSSDSVVAKRCGETALIRRKEEWPDAPELPAPSLCVLTEGHGDVCRTYPVGGPTGKTYFTWNRFSAPPGRALATIHRFYES